MTVVQGCHPETPAGLQGGSPPCPQTCVSINRHSRSPGSPSSSDSYSLHGVPTVISSLTPFFCVPEVGVGSTSGAMVCFPPQSSFSALLVASCTLGHHLPSFCSLPLSGYLQARAHPPLTDREPSCCALQCFSREIRPSKFGAVFIRKNKLEKIFQNIVWRGVEGNKVVIKSYINI